MERITAPFFQVRANAILLYDKQMTHCGRRFFLDNQLKPTYSGKVTPHARKRLMKALDILVQKSPTQTVYNSVTQKWVPFKLNFTTLTIAHHRNLSTSEAYEKLLSKWIRYMREKQGMQEYVWKAEYQKRGQVHYHIAANTYLDWQTVRWRWNNEQRKAGFLEDYALRYGHYNPPSTDVRRMENVDDCLSYMAKEMCKGVQNQKSTKGKVWDCSKGLKIDRFSDHASSDMFALIDDALQNDFATKTEMEHCTIIHTANPQAFLSAQEKARYGLHIK